MDIVSFSQAVTALPLLPEEWKQKFLAMAQGLKDDERAALYAGIEEAHAKRAEGAAEQEQFLAQGERLMADAGAQIHTRIKASHASDEQQERDDALPSLEKQMQNPS